MSTPLNIMAHTADQLKQRQKYPINLKVEMSKLRIREWYKKNHGEVYVSFSGGKDSTVLLELVRSEYPDVPAVFVNTGLEYPEIISFVKQTTNVVWLRPKMGFKAVIEKYGYPVVSKEQAKYIREVQRGTTAYTESKRRWGKNGTRSGMVSKKWQFLFDAPFKISDQCCEVMKKRPMHQYEKCGRKPFVGTMAGDSALRKQSYIRYGCNMVTGKQSRPMMFWTEKDVWDYIRLNNIAYSKIYDMGESRTGCMFCMFGVHLEKGKNRFQRMQLSHPNIYKHCIENLKLNKVLDYIKVPYKTKEERVMPPTKHSTIGASSCPRYWECPGSVRLGKDAPEQETSFAAAEGTCAHGVAEKALIALKTGKSIDLNAMVGHTEMHDDHEIEITEEMVAAVRDYIKVIKYDLTRFGTNLSFLEIEQGFQLEIDEEAYGTLDASVYIPFDVLNIYDFKYGKGVVVEVQGNKQLLFYGLGAMKDKDISRVRTVIVQPRAYHPDGPVREATYTVELMLGFQEKLLEKIVATRDPESKVVPGKHCKFCKAIAICDGVRAEANAVAKVDFDNVGVVQKMDTGVMVQILGMQDRVVDFFKDVRRHLQSRAEKGEVVEGFKLVKAISHRKWKSETRVISEFRSKLGDKMLSKPKLLTPAQLEKVAKNILEKDALLPYIEKPDKGLTLVADSDPRQIVKSSASDDFKDI